MHEYKIINYLPGGLQEDETPSNVYSLSSYIRIKAFNYKDTVNNINIDNKSTYETGISSWICANSKYSNHYHGSIITDDLSIIKDKKNHKIISKVPTNRKPKTINLGKKVKKAS